MMTRTPARSTNQRRDFQEWVRGSKPGKPLLGALPNVAVKDAYNTVPTPAAPERHAVPGTISLHSPKLSTRERPDQTSLPRTESSSQVAARLRARRHERNNERLRTVDADDRRVLEGELTAADRHEYQQQTTNGGPERTYLEVNPESFFPPPLEGPNDRFTPPGWFLSALTEIGNTQEPTPNKSPIQFASTAEAARANDDILRSVNYDLEELIKQFPNTTLGYGSEFRSTKQLRTLLGRHPNFNMLAQVIDHGMDYIFTRELSPEEQRTEMLVILARGNHKSAQALPDQVSKLLDKDVVHGFAIPIPITTVVKIPNAGVQPLGLASQWTIDTSGVRVTKYRLTQDLSFFSSKTGPNLSINKRIDMTAYPEMVYGWCLPRILHFVVALRLKFPGLAILIAKYDYSDAYRRIAHSAQTAMQTIAVQEPFAYMSLRLTFGGAPNPPTWCMFSEIVTDLANEISACRAWNPDTLRSPAQTATPEPIRVDDSIPMAPAREMAVVVPTGDDLNARVDGFIDDLINVFLDTPQNCSRQPHVVPLAMHATSRPHAGDDLEPIPRRAILSTPKLIAEGSPAEVQTVLGWNLDTRRLQLSLPLDKFLAWVADIETVLKEGECLYTTLEQLVGRLNHASYVLPTARHFLSRLRGRIEPKYRKSKRKLKLSGDELDDLVLWKNILATAHGGISLNLLVTRQPDRICWSDACPFGIGGYSVSGHAWRVQIPEGSILRGHRGVNNLLEFVGMAVNIWIECTCPGAGQLLDPTAARRNPLLDFARAANRSIVLDSCQEGRNESYDRVWRRWLGFCSHTGYANNPLLSLLPELERDVVTKSFLQCYRTAQWSPTGSLTGVRPIPLGVGTIRQAAGHLASAFRSHIGVSPLHVEGGTNLRPFARRLMRAFENTDPPPRQQRAATPKLLRAMHTMSGGDCPLTHDTALTITTEIAIVAYFFAMRSCEITSTPSPGRTRVIQLRGVVFRDADHNELEHNSPELKLSAERVTLTFEDQKNGQKMDRRTHQRTGDPVLCPVKNLASLVARILRLVPDARSETQINATRLSTKNTHITSDLLRSHMRTTCTLLGGAKVFGFEAKDIGTKSLRSGAAMSLFLMNHPVHKIMILGRWSSDAFLVYIRPQVLEWTNNMSRDMIANNSFLDVTDSRRTAQDDPRTRESPFRTNKDFIPIRLKVH
ncbi:hypothetical protein MHU86_2355 [Fragilaria crotonensis]|nr:hypothetical protein MHU86_2355 [Fragilaria crotonensis]